VWAEKKVDRVAIEQGFASAGWNIDAGFLEYLLIGYNGDGLSILAHREVWETEDPVFELIDHERNLTYGVQEYRPPSRPHRFSKSTASPPKSLTTTRSRRRRLRRARKLGATYFYLLV
jgi:hypothetical protein